MGSTFLVCENGSYAEGILSHFTGFSPGKKWLRTITKRNENEFILQTHGGNDDFTIEFIGRITNKPLIQISS